MFRFIFSNSFAVVFLYKKEERNKKKIVTKINKWFTLTIFAWNVLLFFRWQSEEKKKVCFVAVVTMILATKIVTNYIMFCVVCFQFRCLSLFDCTFHVSGVFGDIFLFVCLFKFCYLLFVSLKKKIRFLSWK